MNDKSLHSQPPFPLECIPLARDSARMSRERFPKSLLSVPVSPRAFFQTAVLNDAHRRARREVRHRADSAGTINRLQGERTRRSDSTFFLFVFNRAASGGNSKNVPTRSCRAVPTKEPRLRRRILYLWRLVDRLQRFRVKNEGDSSKQRDKSDGKNANEKCERRL